jgi:DNA-binding transcriptional LysR family regulator
MAVSLGSDRDLLTQVETGALDVAVTTLKPSGRTLQHRYVGVRRYVLIGSMGAEGPREGPPSRQLGTWLNSQPWVSYSEERPVTRRFFQQSLECRFEAKVSLVVPDLRAVVRAVELGVGISIVPEFACRRGLDEGRLRELFPIADSIPSEPWFLAYRDLDSDREQVHRISQALAER